MAAVLHSSGVCMIANNQEQRLFGYKISLVHDSNESHQKFSGLIPYRRKKKKDKVWECMKIFKSMLEACSSRIIWSRSAPTHEPE